jgi:hypothetical protein
MNVRATARIDSSPESEQRVMAALQESNIPATYDHQNVVAELKSRDLHDLKRHVKEITRSNPGKVTVQVHTPVIYRVFHMTGVSLLLVTFLLFLGSFMQVLELYWAITLPMFLTASLFYWTAQKDEAGFKEACRQQLEAEFHSTKVVVLASESTSPIS